GPEGVCTGSTPAQGPGHRRPARPAARKAVRCQSVGQHARHGMAVLGSRAARPGRARHRSARLPLAVLTRPLLAVTAALVLLGLPHLRAQAPAPQSPREFFGYRMGVTRRLASWASMSQSMRPCVYACPTHPV